MTENNLVIMNAPQNCTGLGILGESYEVAGGQALIPGHLVGHAQDHGFTIAPEDTGKKVKAAEVKPKAEEAAADKPKAEAAADATKTDGQKK